MATRLPGHNVYLEARTVREGLRGNKRGGLEDTAWVFGLVADCDADKHKGGDITIKPSLAVETSPGNFQLWYLFTHAIPAEQARAIGDAIRTSSGNRSGHRRHHAMLPRPRHPELPLAEEAGARPHHGRADPNLRVHGPAVGPG